MAEPEPAVILADQDAGEAHIGELLPQIAAEPGRVIVVAQLAHMADGGVFGDEILRRVAQHRLLVIQEKRHFLLLRHPVSPSVIPASAGMTGRANGSIAWIGSRVTRPAG